MNQRFKIFFVLFSLLLICQVSAFTSRFEYLSPQDVPEFTFTDPKGYPVTLAHFKGKVVIFNIWSITCAPCMSEMPYLDKLSGLYPDKDLVVIALNVDSAKIKLLNALFLKNGYQFLNPYHDKSRVSQDMLKWKNIPATYIFNKEGKLVGRQIGYAKWDSPEALQMFDHLIAGKNPGPSESFWKKIKNWWTKDKNL